MKLSYLLKECTPLWRRSLDPASDPGSDPEITSIHNDSRDVKPGGLFIAVRGFKIDGHDYVEDALERGAAAVVVQQRVPGKQRMVEVADTRKAMASIAARFYDNPSESMCLVGITGTNGKTTTSFILESIFAQAGHCVGVIGTVNFRYRGKLFNNPVTTPESIDLQRILAQMKAAQVSHVVMEVSSHSIDLHRVRNCRFDAGVFTNLTQDHLDYHRTMGRYFACKRRFFTRILPSGPKALTAMAVINLDDEKGQALRDAAATKVVTTGRDSRADVCALDLAETITGTTGILKIDGAPYPFSSALVGAFNVENILSAAGAAHAIGIDPQVIVRGIEGCKGVPGRLERVEPDNGRHVFVDYAHTPDALMSILETLKAQAPKRIITVVGCGGDRDRSKRPIMGQIAATLSDVAIITSDNPRSEDPHGIIQEILKGIDTALCPELKPDQLKTGNGFFVEPDRRKALELAVAASTPGDILVAAGKGHETYQILKGGTIHFDDREILSSALAGVQGLGETL
ncbi:MurE [Desulforapulum autotrophicum HRM2]|uniref:UDP-N-acetylmuramoyl-L-alanyl-D-glutamate--2,6-diaminopimelate ligase n=1 Tax=Desulforapulum autotrophicum (strain ATCC 43914 / DSM 3382 / VKM B-1955 / HRM2) TaxID=177437 RepID=C0Q8N8_DESAH|nr:UDP-N-acetylmuramoyl-L-alanyl-D-glutamate--2,6-diaminopimelate ligase [Desulforapulum autotrophicum]ACN14378.1 MurE [Desulforapulum autotrophicum HRM2]